MKNEKKDPTSQLNNKLKSFFWFNKLTVKINISPFKR